MRPVQQEVHQGTSPEVPQQGAPQRPLHPAAVGGGGEEDEAADECDWSLRGAVRSDRRRDSPAHPGRL
jgi:hypothetical protein